jgi:hypothetical protein
MVESQKGSGVITRIEDVAGGEDPAPKGEDRARSGRTRGGKRLTVNTAAVWRDYVREQPSGDDKGRKAETPKVDHSVTTKGQPASRDVNVTVLATPRTRIETRWRASDDEATEGAGTSAEARQKPAAKAVTGGLSDLKTGQFVDVEYRRGRDRNSAFRIYILRPSGGPNTPALGADTAGKAADKGAP